MLQMNCSLLILLPLCLISNGNLCLNLVLSGLKLNNLRKSSSDNMKYFGLQSQIWKNNTNSVLILVMFPIVFFVLTWFFFFFISFNSEEHRTISQINQNFLLTAPFIIIGVV